MNEQQFKQRAGSLSSYENEPENYVKARKDLEQLMIKYNPQIQIFAESETKRPFFKCSFKTKRTKKGLAHNTNNKARNKSQNHSISGLALSSTIQQAI